MENYKIAVAGTGCVGLSLSVLLAQHNQVMAVDIVQAKVDMINNHKSPIQDDYIYLVGAKSLGAYGGYETFVYKLTEHHQNKENIKYHVACKANGDGCMDETKFDGVTKINDHEFELHNAHCFKIDVPQIGPAQAIYYDVAALKACCDHIKKNHIPHPIVYIMACRIGPFARCFYKEIHKLGGIVYLNRMAGKILYG